MDIQFCTNQIELLIQNCSPNTNVNRDKYIIQLAITILPKIETPKGNETPYEIKNSQTILYFVS